MFELYEKYISLHIDGKLICLEHSDCTDTYFCYPKNTKAIGFEGCIMYCFIDGYGETVFACNPESGADIYVYPLANSFKDFIALILSCGSTNPIEQIIWMNKEQFNLHLKREIAQQTTAQAELLTFLSHELDIKPISSPFEYVKKIQANFDYSKISFHDEYYDVLGIDR